MTLVGAVVLGFVVLSPLAVVLTLFGGVVFAMMAALLLKDMLPFSTGPPFRRRFSAANTLPPPAPT